MTLLLRVVYWVCTVLCIWGILGGLAQAQYLRPDNAVGVALDQTLSPEQENAAKRIGSGLRCPVCQGVPISESPADLARQMMLEVRKQVKAGQTEAQITDFFASRYGDHILLNPPKRGLNWLLWLLPVAALLAGGVWSWWYLQPKTKPETPIDRLFLAQVEQDLAQNTPKNAASDQTDTAHTPAKDIP